MEQDRRDLFRKIGILGASALALVGVSKRAKAFEGATQQNPLLGLWDMTTTVPNLYFKYAISEGGYVCTGNEDANFSFANSTYSPTMGTYVQTGPNTYRLRERRWAMDISGKPVGYSDFRGWANVADDGLTFSGKGLYIQYDLNGNEVFTLEIGYTATKFTA